MDNSKPQILTVRKDLGVNIDYVYIVPLSDLHIGGDFYDSAFLRIRDWIVDTPHVYCVINGDILEMVTKKSKGDAYGQLRPKEQRKLAIKYLEPLVRSGKILAYLDGNHEARVQDETDEYVGETICENLGIPSLYHPDGIYLFLSVGHDRSQNKKTRLLYTMYMLHGWTAARRIGGKFNNLEDMQRIAHADIFLMSHIHQKGAFPKKIIVPDPRHKNIAFRKQLFVAAGAFSEYAGYAVKKGYAPTELGMPYIGLSGRTRDFCATI